MQSILQPENALALPPRSVALVLSDTEHEKLRIGVWLLAGGIFLAGVIVGRLTASSRDKSRKRS